MMVREGQQFWKMSGSGNDFIFFDDRSGELKDLAETAMIDRLCARATGIGADGVVFFQADEAEVFRIRYFNRDGSLAELCGNASLCSAKLAVHLGIASPDGFRFQTDAGLISARISGGAPEIDLRPVRDLLPSVDIEPRHSELRLGFADTGVPHLVVLVPSIKLVDVIARGRALRHDSSLPEGANVNFVAREKSGTWGIRTFERGVEGETLACGTGAVASAVLLKEWGLSGAETILTTKSGGLLTVTLGSNGGTTGPSLRGEGRLVFAGRLGDV